MEKTPIVKFLDHIGRAQAAWSIGGGLVMSALGYVWDFELPWIIFIGLGAVAFLLIILHRWPHAEYVLSSGPVRIMSLRVLKETPSNNYSAIRLELKNQSGKSLSGLIARLMKVEPEALSIAKPGQIQRDITLPVNLATKGRLDLLRIKGQPIPAKRFNLGPWESKEVEVFWIYTNGSLEVNITHEAGDDDFVFMENQYDFHVEISGIGRPAKAVVTLEKTNEETGEWNVRSTNLRG